MSYRRRVLQRAWADTKAIMRAKNRTELVVSSLSVVVVTTLLYLLFGADPALDLLRLTVAGVGGFGIVFLALFVLHVALAPARLAMDDALALRAVEADRDAVRAASVTARSIASYRGRVLVASFIPSFRSGPAAHGMTGWPVTNLLRSDASSYHGSILVT